MKQYRRFKPTYKKLQPSAISQKDAQNSYWRKNSTSGGRKSGNALIEK